MQPGLFSFSTKNIKVIHEEIANLNTKKPTTQNTIPAKILLENIDTCTPLLTKIYNDSVNIGNFPTVLKSADMTPGYKKDDKTSKENYRPVSVLPTVSNIFWKDYVLRYRKIHE